MKHRMSAAKLIVSSYGDSFDPTTQKPPHTLAKNLDPGGVIQKLLDSYVHLWLSANGRSSEDALDDGRHDRPDHRLGGDAGKGRHR